MRILTVLLLTLSLSACGLFYRVPVRQGNVLTPSEVAQLKTGMSKDQVQYVMGTSLLQGGFENNRWDYIFYYRDPDARVRQSAITLYFVNNQLTEINGKKRFLQASHGGQLTDAEGDTLR